jgi:hypothetical protein
LESVGDDITLIVPSPQSTSKSVANEPKLTNGNVNTCPLLTDTVIIKGTGNPPPSKGTNLLNIPITIHILN